MSKIIVLNSGGFDSTTLLLQTVEDFPSDEVVSLYFSYGQLNEKFDSEIASSNAKKLGIQHYAVNLPKISWSKGNFYNSGSNEYQTQYLEMRNLIFISYAVSLGESLNADVIKMAILKSHGYKDTSAEFIEVAKKMCELGDMSFDTPFSEFDKQGIFGLAKILGVGKKYDFLSCDTPDNEGSPCGKCADCESINEYNEVLTDDIPVKAFFSEKFNTQDKTFRELFINSEVTELRLIINDDCQLNCPHCYHSGNSLIDTPLTDDEVKNAIKEAYDYGIREFHFAGKEPLINERIFIFADYLNTLQGAKYHVVTNGITVPKYARLLKSKGFEKVFLSADNQFGEKQAVLRNSKALQCVKNAVLSLNAQAVPIEIFYDLTPDNIMFTVKNIKYWYLVHGVKDFYVRTIRDIGKEGFDKFHLNVKSLEYLHTELSRLSLDGLNVTLNIGACPYFYDIMLGEHNSDLKNDIVTCGLYGSSQITENYNLFAEAYCGKYENRITLTADGYILGCAMECSVKEYDKISVGNIKNNSFKDLIKRGKEVALATNDYQTRDSKIFFNKCEFNSIDI